MLRGTRLATGPVMTDGSSDAPAFDWGNDRFTVVRLRLRLPPDLTRAEREVVELVLRGYTDREVAAYRGTAVRTVANNVVINGKGAAAGAIGSSAYGIYLDDEVSDVALTNNTIAYSTT